ncbi:uncharacterized protein LOC120510897, partial [Passer montanus]|uniref:uncharacterized protein LOC120510897 n=1 Tax=Passer montanus TaxID=9160 RepID=UPI001960846D
NGIGNGIDNRIGNGIDNGINEGINDGIGDGINEIDNGINNRIGDGINDGIGNGINGINDGINNGISDEISDGISDGINDGINGSRNQIRDWINNRINNGIRGIQAVDPSGSLGSPSRRQSWRIPVDPSKSLGSPFSLSVPADSRLFRVDPSGSLGSPSRHQSRWILVDPRCRCQPQWIPAGSRSSQWIPGIPVLALSPSRSPLILGVPSGSLGSPSRCQSWWNPENPWDPHSCSQSQQIPADSRSSQWIPGIPAPLSVPADSWLFQVDPSGSLGSPLLLSPSRFLVIPGGSQWIPGIPVLAQSQQIPGYSRWIPVDPWDPRSCSQSQQIPGYSRWIPVDPWDPHSCSQSQQIPADSRSSQWIPGIPAPLSVPADSWLFQVDPSGSLGSPLLLSPSRFLVIPGGSQWIPGIPVLAQSQQIPGYSRWIPVDHWDPHSCSQSQQIPVDPGGGPSGSP